MTKVNIIIAVFFVCSTLIVLNSQLLADSTVKDAVNNVSEHGGVGNGGVEGAYDSDFD
jgi:uncharacterized membrane protein